MFIKRADLEEIQYWKNKLRFSYMRAKIIYFLLYFALYPKFQKIN